MYDRPNLRQTCPQTPHASNEYIYIYIYIHFGHSITCISNLMLHIVDWGCCLIHARRPLDDFLLSPLDSPFSYLFSRLCSLFSVRSFRSTHFSFLSFSLLNTILSFDSLHVSFFACLHSPAVLFSRLSRHNYSFCCFVLSSHISLPSCLRLLAGHGNARQGKVRQGQSRQGIAKSIKAVRVKQRRQSKA